MAHLIIPDTQNVRDAFSLLIKLSTSDMVKLKEALKNAEPALSVHDLVKKISPELGLEPSQVQILISVLASLYSAKSERDIPLESFSAELCDALKRTGKPDLQLSDDQLPQFRRDIEELLSLDASLGVAARALDVMTEHQRIWRTSRILTDLRPVFGPDPTKSPAAGVIVHNLKIGYRENDRLMEFFVALDAQDLQQLKKIVDRAMSKAQSLKTFAKVSGLTCLDSEESDVEK